MATLTIILITGSSFAAAPKTILPITIFPLENYDQNIDNWLKPDQEDYDTSLLTKQYQEQRHQDFYRHFYASNKQGLSPWSQNYVEAKFLEQPTFYQQIEETLSNFNNDSDDANKKIYGENFRLYSEFRIKKVVSQIPIQSLKNLTYNSQNRAIIIANTESYTLPNRDLVFHNQTIAGQGYPFNILQSSALWVGTPVYILAKSYDQSFAYVLTDSYAAWVPAQNVALASKQFIKKWQQLARINMLALTATEAPIITEQKIFLSHGYIGTVLPFLTKNKKYYTALYPIRNLHGKAIIQKALIDLDQAKIMPAIISKRNIANIIKELINRPYSWGGMYFYNDCSQELKSLFTPFSIWMARDSKNQTSAAKMIDQSALNPDDRLNYLIKYGHPLLTMIYIDGHIFLYLGQYQQPKDPSTKLALSYQNIWGLRLSDNSQRAVIGQSVLLPITNYYPEDKNLMSLLTKPHFNLIYLDQWPDQIYN